MSEQIPEAVPLVSVILPVFNCRRFVEESIDSILSQTYRHIELIVVDDASTDGTYEFLVSTYSNNPRIRLIQNEKNKGIAFTLNRAIALSNGWLIARMDGDDISLPERLERQVEAFLEDEELAICGTLGSYIDEKGIEIGDIKLPLDLEGIRKMAQYFNPIIHPSYMVNIQQVEYLYAPEAVPVEDWYFLVSAAHSVKVRNLGEKLIFYRRYTIPHAHSSELSDGFYSQMYKRFEMSRRIRGGVSKGQGVLLESIRIRRGPGPIKLFLFRIAMMAINSTRYRSNQAVKAAAYIFGSIVSRPVRSYCLAIFKYKMAQR